MRSVATWLVAILIALAAVVGLIAFLNSRDQGGVNQSTAAAAGPGEIYRGQPVLPPALQAAVNRGNVVILYRDAQPPSGTARLLPPGGRALLTAGQAVVLHRDPTLKAPLVALSARKFEQTDTPQQLQPFVDYWLGGR
ncbi:MAG TPA: hypothetical protein VH300_05715 [Thermoleophilaceae bacterium]|jgi:hypothetical protein|nr:hypothetical protein [Thermoleophilaceae bacterium]